jgi:hypothetical protein
MGTMGCAVMIAGAFWTILYPATVSVGMTAIQDINILAMMETGILLPTNPRRPDHER